MGKKNSHAAASSSVNSEHDDLNTSHGNDDHNRDLNGLSSAPNNVNTQIPRVSEPNSSHGHAAIGRYNNFARDRYPNTRNSQLTINRGWEDLALLISEWMVNPENKNRLAIAVDSALIDYETERAKYTKTAGKMFGSGSVLGAASRSVEAKPQQVSEARGPAVENKNDVSKVVSGAVKEYAGQFGCWVLGVVGNVQGALNSSTEFLTDWFLSHSSEDFLKKYGKKENIASLAKRSSPVEKKTSPKELENKNDEPENSDSEDLDGPDLGTRIDPNLALECFQDIVYKGGEDVGWAVHNHKMFMGRASLKVQMINALVSHFRQVFQDDDSASQLRNSRHWSYDVANLLEDTKQLNPLEIPGNAAKLGFRILTGLRSKLVTDSVNSGSLSK